MTNSPIFIADRARPGKQAASASRKVVSDRSPPRKSGWRVMTREGAAALRRGLPARSAALGPPGRAAVPDRPYGPSLQAAARIPGYYPVGTGEKCGFIGVSV
jgi:hypothetical protein